MGFNGKQWKLMEANGKQWKQMKSKEINGSQW